MKAPNTAKKQKLLATGGGNAVTSGASFQASVAAYFASLGLANEQMDPRLGLGNAKAKSFRFETEAPVDDILISLDSGGWVFFQAKNSLDASKSLTSEIGKTCDEFVRLWEACRKGSSLRGWDRNLVAGLDAIVIAVGPTTSGSIKNHLARALDNQRSGSAATLSKQQQSKLDEFRELIRKAIAEREPASSGIDADEILKFIHVLEFDFGGPSRTTAETVLANSLVNRTAAPAALATLEKECERRMAARNGIDVRGLRAELARDGVPMAAPPDYRPDIAALNDRTSKFAGILKDFERTQVSDAQVTISRACTSVCLTAAKAGSLVLVGDPGAGKSAVINETARRLGAEGHDVVLLPVDRLPVESIEGLSSALGISHALVDVLSNWPGSGPGFLILDALDACRFGKSEALFRTVMQDVLELEGGRWRIIASIRTFDLDVGQSFRRLFRGVPPAADLTDQRFQDVRHIRVPEWSDAEFDELVKKLPALGTAIENGGPKLAELSRVPFNTRLLSDLLTAGVAPEELRTLGSQVQLLEMYWRQRVSVLGVLAEKCLGSTVLAMIDRSRMEAPKIQAAENSGTALDHLLQNGVLVAANRDRDVVFRHHILFDYSASRTLVDLEDAAKTAAMLGRPGASLLLAQALLFALQHLWETSGPGRDRFWRAVVDLAGDRTDDPIVRSVAARTACEMPGSADDIGGLVRLMAQPEYRKKAFSTFRDLVSALTVRVEDDREAPPAPWCALAESAVPFVIEIAWPLRVLVNNFFERASDPDHRRQLGAASRALMDFAFDARGGETLMPLAIAFVAKTYSTDPIASRQLVERLLSPERMAEHASDDMHWLADEIRAIADQDTDLAVAIYNRVFEFKVKDNTPTTLGNSKILNLISDRRQDFKMAQWALNEGYSALSRKYPNAATASAIRVARNYVRNEYPSKQEHRCVLTVANRSGRNSRDRSFIWAAAEKRMEHADDAVQVVEQFTRMLTEVPDAEAIAIADLLIDENEQAWLWNRLLAAANARGGVLAEKMWPWAAQPGLLSELDTITPAIDLLVSQYRLRSSNERRELEETVCAMTFPSVLKPEEVAKRFRRRVFSAIGPGALETQAAKDIAKEVTALGADISPVAGGHREDFEYIDLERYDWLTSRGVDVSAAPNASILAEVDDCSAATTSEGAGPDPLISSLLALRERLADLSSATADPRVVVYGWTSIAQTIERLASGWAEESLPEAARLGEIEELLAAALPAVQTLLPPEDEFSGRARQSIAAAIMIFITRVPHLAKRFSMAVREFASDANAAVRVELATRIDGLWNADRELLWSIVQSLAPEEKNARVLGELVSFLLQVSNLAPALVETIGQTILGRDDIEASDEDDLLHEASGALMFHLWNSHGQETAYTTIRRWLAERIKFKVELGHGAYQLRQSLIVGYDSDRVNDRKRCERSQQLAFEIIDVAASGLEQYFELGTDNQTEERSTQATADAALLDRMSDQFFFAIGPSEIRKGGEPHVLKEYAARQRFLSDNEKAFRRIGDVGIPGTIYHFLQLLDFLLPGDPQTVFDLTAHALLHGGKLHGYQTESLGAKQLVSMIGRMIADYRDLFVESDRRLALVQILEVFVDVGWPDARRLLYRLPEALR